MNKSLITLIAVGSLLAGGVVAQRPNITRAERVEILRRRAARLESQARNNAKEAGRLTDEAKKASTLWPLFGSRSGMLTDQSYNLLVEGIRLREQAEFYRNQAENLGVPPKF